MSTLETGRAHKPLRLKVRNAQTPREKHSQWLRITTKSDSEYLAVRELMSGAKLHTVCAEAGCPSVHECWEDREATFLVDGTVCTRRCSFCDIASGKPEPIDPGEPERLAQTMSHLGLKYITIIGMTRDDQPEAAIWLYAEATRQIHATYPETRVKLLMDNFCGTRRTVGEVFSVGPQIFGHNLGTVPRLMHQVRPAFDCHRTLDIISQARSRELIAKSNLMLGLGKKRHKIEATMRSMLNAGVDILTIIQYLHPSPRYLPIERWVKPQEFVESKNLALEMDFAACMSGSLARLSYRAGKLWVAAMRHYERLVPPRFAHLEDGSDKPTWQEAESVVQHQQ